MTRNREKIEILWACLEDAKLQLDFSHNYTREIVDDLRSGRAASAETEYSTERAVRVEQLALENCYRQLDQLQRLIVCGDLCADEDDDLSRAQQPSFARRQPGRNVWRPELD